MMLQIPNAAFSLFLVVANGLLVLDMILSTRSLVEPPQARGGASAWLLKLLLTGNSGNDQQEPEGSIAYRYGLRPVFGVGGCVTALASLVLVGSSFEILIEPVAYMYLSTVFMGHGHHRGSHRKI